jgi:maltooligosyltrehalose trehalohydrolase
MRARRRLPAGDADEIAFDEDARWLRVRRGAFELVCNFSDRIAVVPCASGDVELATHGAPRLREGRVELDPFAGALMA